MSLPDDMVSLIPQSEARDAFCYFAEIILDATLEEGMIKDVPVIGALVKAGSAFMTVRDRLFVRKLLRFLKSLEDVPALDRGRFVQDLGNEENRRKIGEKILLIIDKQDDFDKAEIVGFAFKRYIEGQIDRGDFDALAHAISHLNIADLKDLSSFDEGMDRVHKSSMEAVLFSLNLATMNVLVEAPKWEDSPETKVVYKVSRRGRELLNVIKEYKNRN